MRLPQMGVQTFQNVASRVVARFSNKTPQVSPKTFNMLYRRMDCALSGFIFDATTSAQVKNSKLFENANGLLLAKKDTIPRRLFEAGRDFLEIPFDVLSEIASKFPKSKLNNSQFLQNHRAHILAEKELAALHGARDAVPDIAEFLKKSGIKIEDIVIKKNQNGKCLDSCEKICNAVGDYLNPLLNKTMEFGNSIFDTKKERFTTRIVSGFLPAFFLGADYFNKAKLKGKSDEDAKKAQYGKQFQEIKETIDEGIMQYLLSACFSEFLNGHVTAGAISGLIIGTASRIHSRMSEGRPIKRVKTPENSMTEFVRAAKAGETYKTQSEIDKEAKPTLLSMKNIVKGCAIAAAAVYALRFASNTKVAQKFLAPFKNKLKQFELSNIEDVVASRTDIDKFKSVLKQCGESKYTEWIDATLGEELVNGTADINLGTRYKTIKLLGLFEVEQKELKMLPLMPFKFVKEIFCYPYKLVNKLEAPVKKGINSITNLVRKAQGKQVIPLPETKKTLEGNAFIKDNYNFKNVFLKYKEFEKKFGSDPDKLQKEFGKYLHEMRVASLNKKTSSKVDNTTVAAISQITGSLSGIWFNMNDDYNAAIKNGENRAEARKAARLRGINKIARTTSQAAIWGTIAGILRKQYGGSLIGSMIVVGMSSFLTDKVSRLLTAMPTRKMKTKEELEAYQKSQKEGKMAWYYNGIDRLAS